MKPDMSNTEKVFPKSYILMRETVNDKEYPVGKAINSAAHAGTMILMHWDKDDPIIKLWLSQLIRKVTCKVSSEEFDQAKRFDDFIVITESSENTAEVGLVFKPRIIYPKFFKYLKLYK